MWNINILKWLCHYCLFMWFPFKLFLLWCGFRYLVQLYVCNSVAPIQKAWTGMVKWKTICSMYKFDHFIYYSDKKKRKIRIFSQSSKKNSTFFYGWRDIFKFYINVTQVDLCVAWSAVRTVHVFVFQKYLLRTKECFAIVDTLFLLNISEADKWRKCLCLWLLWSGSLNNKHQLCLPPGWFLQNLNVFKNYMILTLFKPSFCIDLFKRELWIQTVIVVSF